MLLKPVGFISAVWKYVCLVYREKDLKGLFLTVFILLVTGVIVYSRAEGWSWFDSLYFSVTILTTVGLGDLAPRTTIGKAFTIFYLLIGIGIVLMFINGIAKHARDNMKRRH